MDVKNNDYYIRSLVPNVVKLQKSETASDTEIVFIQPYSVSVLNLNPEEVSYLKKTYKNQILIREKLSA